LISLIFILSSISKENHIKVVQNTKRMLKQGGSVIVRDYAANDQYFIFLKQIKKHFLAQCSGLEGIRELASAFMPVRMAQGHIIFLQVAYTF